MRVVKIKHSPGASQKPYCTEPRATNEVYGDLVEPVAAVAIGANDEWHTGRQKPSAWLSDRSMHSSHNGDLVKSVGPGSGIEVRIRQRAAAAVIAEACWIFVR